MLDAYIIEEIKKREEERRRDEEARRPRLHIDIEPPKERSRRSEEPHDEDEGDAEPGEEEPIRIRI